MEVELDSGATAGAGAARYLGASRIVIARLSPVRARAMGEMNTRTPSLCRGGGVGAPAGAGAARYVGASRI